MLFCSNTFYLRIKDKLNNNHEKTISVLFLILFSASNAQQMHRENYADVLDVKTVVSNPKNITTNLLVIWEHGMLMRCHKIKEDYGSFIGPVIMDLDGQWLANTISKIRIKENGIAIDLQKSKVVQHYYPGLLKQIFTVDGLDIEQQLIFVSGREARIKISIYNRSKAQKDLTVSFDGKFYPMSFLTKEIMK